jgi:CubicO group peptidase (beta-lactamase class C family)
MTVPTTAENFKRATDYSAGHSGRAVRVTVDGESVFERYHNDFGPDTATHLHSATKEFWGPVIAAMIEDGLIESFDELAAKTLPEWKELLLTGQSPDIVRQRPGGVDRSVDLLLQRMDRNGDGKITPDETGPQLRRWFERLDRNGNGMLEAPEVRPLLERRSDNR